MLIKLFTFYLVSKSKTKPEKKNDFADTQDVEPTAHC